MHRITSLVPPKETRCLQVFNTILILILSGATLETTFHRYTRDFREFKIRWLRVLGTGIIRVNYRIITPEKSRWFMLMRVDDELQVLCSGVFMGLELHFRYFHLFHPCSQPLSLTSPAFQDPRLTADSRHHGEICMQWDRHVSRYRSNLL